MSPPGRGLKLPFPVSSPGCDAAYKGGLLDLFFLGDFALPTFQLGVSLSIQERSCERKVPHRAPLKGTEQVLSAALGAAAIPALPKTA